MSVLQLSSSPPTATGAAWSLAQHIPGASVAEVFFPKKRGK